MPIKDKSTYIQDGISSAANGHILDGQETTETDPCGAWGMRQPVERKHSTKNDPVHLQRRMGLFSGVALIVGTMIGMAQTQSKFDQI